MSQDGFKNVTADKALTRDIEKAQTPEEIRYLLHAAVERSGIAVRDPESGQFVRREPLTPAAQTADEPKQITKVEKIGGRDLTFTGTEESVAEQIIAAYKVAEALTPVPEPRVQVVRQKTQAEIEREISDRAELDLQFRRGQLTTEEYLTRTNAIGEFLAARGFDLDAAAAAQVQQGWKEAVETFLQTTPEGRVWRGGMKNLQQAQILLEAHGWTDGIDGDKVAALRAIAKEMREKGIEFDGDFSAEQLETMTKNATPQEILEAWKQAQGNDPEAANQEFIRIQNGGSSGVFDR